MWECRIESMEKDTLSAQETTVVVDAILSGTNREVSSWFAEAIDEINSSSLPIISIDLPSGMMIDLICRKIVKADATLTIQSPQAAFYWRKFRLCRQFVYTVGYRPVNPFMLISHLNISIRLGMPSNPNTKKASHKGHYGHAAIF